MVLVGFSLVVKGSHRPAGYRILYYCTVDSMYIRSLWIYNCGDCINALTCVCHQI